MEENAYPHLTDIRKEVAERIYERHQFFTSHLIDLGVTAEQAEQEACRIEHIISEEGYQVLKKTVQDGKQE